MLSSLLWDFNNGLPTLSPLSQSVEKQSHSFDTQPNKNLTLSTNRQPCGRHHEKSMTTQPHQKQHMMLLRSPFLRKSGALSISQGRNQIISTWWISSDSNVNCSGSKHGLHHYATSSLPTTHWTIHLPLKLDDGHLQRSQTMPLCSYKCT